MESLWFYNDKDFVESVFPLFKDLLTSCFAQSLQSLILVIKVLSQ